MQTSNRHSNRSRLQQLLASLCTLIGISWQTTTLQAAEPAKPTPEGIRFFENKIRPLLINKCNDCHGADEQESDLRMDNWAGMLKGGKAGPVVVPGKPKSSLLITAVSYRDNDLQMPPDEKLTAAEIKDLTAWVAMGAPHPDAGKTMAPKLNKGIDIEAGRKHWAFQPPARPAVPQIPASDWVKNPIDAFVYTQLQNKKLSPADKADKRTLIRRVTFDLIGLPPTIEEVNNFLADDSDEALLHVVDRLLMSPQYGERWGRHWLDVARYADSNGLDENVAHGNAWKYRDYVVNAFNKDKPYDQFLIEQLAGDLLPAGDDYQKRNEQLIATGFLVLGPKVLAEPDKTKMQMDIVDEQIDTVGRTFMGLTFGCARCHDHKFDPLGQDDYYALAGIFKSTTTMESFKTIARWQENDVANPSQAKLKKEYNDKLAELNEKIKQLTEKATAELKAKLGKDAKLPKKPRTKFSAEQKAELKKLDAKLAELKKKAPVIPTAMGIVDGKIEDVPIHIRGSHLTLGDIVPRRFPQVLVSGEATAIPADRSGRLDLARWLTSPDHPLTARVMANRIWRWHFGQGLVATPDNFGQQGETPTHPKLLDWLARYFSDNGYSIKAMHRLILTSNTYQMSSQYDPTNASVDPENRFLWRYNARRLEAEAIRDSHLAVSGELDSTMGGNLLNVKNREFVFNHESKENVDYNFDRRSLYLPVIRNHIFAMFQLFDYSDASTLNGNRQTSTVATQSLYLMNSPFVNRMATALAKKILAAETDDSARVERLYQMAYSRMPTKAELNRALEFVTNANLQTIIPQETPPKNDTNKKDESADKDKSAEKESKKSKVTQLDPQLQTWQTLCQTVLIANEFTYIR